MTVAAGNGSGGGGGSWADYLPNMFKKETAVAAEKGAITAGEKTLLKLFPEMHNKSCTIDEILNNARNSPQNKTPKIIENILTGKTKSGIIGEELYRINKKIIDLNEPLITEDAKDFVNQIYTDTIDPTDRGYKNLMKMMMEDGIFLLLPKSDDAWINFLNPFLRLTRKEKNKTKTIKIRNHD